MKRIEITDDILKLLPLVCVKEEKLARFKKKSTLIDRDDLFYLSDVFPNIMLAWGYGGKREIIGGEVIYPDYLVERAWNTFEYIRDHITDIISILLFTCDKGGMKSGIYTSRNKTKGIWGFEEKNENK